VATKPTVDARRERLTQLLVALLRIERGASGAEAARVFTHQPRERGRDDRKHDDRGRLRLGRRWDG
jgi:hypothetical protein